MSGEALETLRRMFEPMPQDWRRMFAVGDLVELTRPYHLWAEIPVGAVGVVKAIGQDEVMLEKGRPFEVEFDLSPYRIPLAEEIKAAIARMGEEPPEFYARLTMQLGPGDLRRVVARH